MLTCKIRQVTSKRASHRFSTFSGAPSLATSDTTLKSNHTSSSNSDPRLQEIKEWTDGLERLENKPLQKQRYQPTRQKTDDLSKLALGAKVERALGRRLTSQDAIMRAKPKYYGEKPPAVERSISTPV